MPWNRARSASSPAKPPILAGCGRVTLDLARRPGQNCVRPTPRLDWDRLRSCLLMLRPPLPGPYRQSMTAEGVRHRPRINAEPLTNPQERPTGPIESGCLSDLVLRKTTLAKVDAGSHQEACDRRAMHPKALGESSLGLTRSVLCHQPSGLRLGEAALHLSLAASSEGCGSGRMYLSNFRNRSIFQAIFE